MSTRVSREKEAKITRLHPQGVSQTLIAQEIVVSQSMISLVISRFETDVSNAYLDAASKKLEVGDEVNELRLLSPI